jgi:hypothetical protein
MTTNDIVMETVNDVRNALVRAHFEQDDTKKVGEKKKKICLKSSSYVALCK